MSQETETPQYFHDAVRSMQEAPVRNGISVGPIRPPRNLAPLSHAVGLEVDREQLGGMSSQAPSMAIASPGGDAFGRLILLHDPNSDEQWSGAKMRLVAYIQADMDASVASDPLLPEVAWDWLTEALNTPESLSLIHI